MNTMALLLLMPLAGAFISFVFPRIDRMVGLLVALVLLPSAIFLALRVHSEGVLRMSVGGWDAPLGITLYIDGLTAAFLCLTASVGFAVTLYAPGYFSHHQQHPTQQSPAVGWWPLWLLLWTALNALFMAGDAFNLYVTLELMSLAAVSLVAMESHAVTAAIRYLLVGLVGSMFYLLGIGLLYARYGTVDLAGLAASVQPEPAAWVAMALLSGGLMLKAALFPLHFWLPPAHANAPAPVSAILSALVVKAAFYTLLRFWLGPFETLFLPWLGQLLGVLGAGAIIWGSLNALMAQRLKLVVAYSTVAQLGYLFLLFPFVGVANAGTVAWYGAIWLAMSHGVAKAGLFLAAGNILYSAGHDRVTELAGAGKSLPVTLFAIGLSCVSIMGLPPSGGFVGKWLLLNAAFVSGQWWWAVILLVGGVLAAAYSFRVLLHAFRKREVEAPSQKPQAMMEWSALALAVAAILLGLFSEAPFQLLEVGSSVGELTLTETPQ